MTREQEQEQRRFTPRAVWLVWGILVVVLLSLAASFLRAWQTNRALRAELVALQPVVATATAEQATLEARLAYVRSDVYVESWARDKARMALPGETLVVVVGATPTPVVTPVAAVASTPVPTPTPLPFWVQWWRSLMGN